MGYTRNLNYTFSRTLDVEISDSQLCAELSYSRAVCLKPKSRLILHDFYYYYYYHYYYYYYYYYYSKS